jgi:hypothetical protein
MVLAMSLTPRFNKAQLTTLALARVGNPLRKEPLQTSRHPCRFEPEDAGLLTQCFLKSFRSLDLHRLHHHSSLSNNQLYACAAGIFENPESLLDQSVVIAKHLYAKSHHPNIKSGDLCMALIGNIGLGGRDDVRALSIIKSESKQAFLQIAEHDGDLVLSTQQGIYPDKIDKGCLIIDHSGEDGYWVYLFDKSGGNTHFWNRDFVGAKPVKSPEYLTRGYGELCVAFAEKGLPEELSQEDRAAMAKTALSYLSESEEFDEGEFKRATFSGEPEMIRKFDAFKTDYEKQRGRELDPNFAVSKQAAEQVKRRMKSRLRLDVGVDITFSSAFLHGAEELLERGRDEERDMDYVKIYYYREL